MAYDFWKAKDGRMVKVSEMDDLHLLHTIRAIIEGRIFPVSGVITGNSQREKWLTVLKAEAIRRDLDWSNPPTRRISLVEFIFDLFRRNPDSVFTQGSILEKLRQEGIVTPEVDVCNKTDKVTYLHWQAGVGVGTPVGK